MKEGGGNLVLGGLLVTNDVDCEGEEEGLLWAR